MFDPSESAIKVKTLLVFVLSVFTLIGKKNAGFAQNWKGNEQIEWVYNQPNICKNVPRSYSVSSLVLETHFYTSPCFFVIITTNISPNLRSPRLPLFTDLWRKIKKTVFLHTKLPKNNRLVLWHCPSWMTQMLFWIRSGHFQNVGFQPVWGLKLKVNFFMVIL